MKKIISNMGLAMWIICFAFKISLAQRFRPEDRYLFRFEGDMLITMEQFHDVYGTTQQRKAINNPDYYWPNGTVPYKIDQSVLSIALTIRKAIEHWEENTCIRFEELEGDAGVPHVIFADGTGCSAVVGRQWWNTEGQPIHLGKGCNIMGKVAHEIGHAIGFFHEQSRPDRDQYVKVLEENIDPLMLSNFLKRNTIDLDEYMVPYDLSSVMHYGPKAFSTNGKNTLSPTDPTKYFLLGQRKRLSFYDLKLANLLYNCSDNCIDPWSCINGGYMDKSCQCQCPDGFNGTKCENILPVKEPECGGIITESTVIVSPNYPKNYTMSQCVWWIQSPTNTVVKATFNDFDLLNRTKGGECLIAAFELRWENIYDGKTFCGTELSGKSYVSKKNSMAFIFRAGKFLTRRGFNITIELIDNEAFLEENYR